MKTEPNMRSYIAADVRFGSKADMCSALGHVRFVPKADIAFATKIRTVPIRQKPQLCSQGFLN